MEFLIGAFAGILVGIIFTVWLLSTKRPEGILKIYIPDMEDEQPYLYVELNEPVWTICSKKKVQFKVDTQNLKTRK